MPITKESIEKVEARVVETLQNGDETRRLLEEFLASQSAVSQFSMSLLDMFEGAAGEDAAQLGLILWIVFREHYALPTISNSRLSSASYDVERNAGKRATMSTKEFGALLVQEWKTDESAVVDYVLDCICATDDTAYDADEEEAVLITIGTIARVFSRAVSHSPYTSSPPGLADVWGAMEASLFGEIRETIDDFSPGQKDEVMSAFILDCNAHYGNVNPGFNTQAGFEDRGDFAYAGIAELEAGPTPDIEFETGAKVNQFMDAACRVLIALEQDGAFEHINRSADFATLACDHDETLEQSQERLRQVRISGVSNLSPHPLSADTGALEANMP